MSMEFSGGSRSGRPDQTPKAQQDLASSSRTYNTTDSEGIDIEELDERIQTFSQDLLELNAAKSDIQMFKSVSK